MGDISTRRSRLLRAVPGWTAESNALRGVHCRKYHFSAGSPDVVLVCEIWGPRLPRPRQPRPLRRLKPHQKTRLTRQPAPPKVAQILLALLLIRAVFPRAAPVR